MGDIFRMSGENLHLLLSTKRTKIVATRHVFWAQNVPKMLLQPGLRPEPRCGSSQRSHLLAGFGAALRQGREGTKWEGTERKQRGGEGKVEGRREGRGGDGEGEERKGGLAYLSYGGLMPLLCFSPICDIWGCRFSGGTVIFRDHKKHFFFVSGLSTQRHQHNGCSRFFFPVKFMLAAGAYSWHPCLC